MKKHLTHFVLLSCSRASLLIEKKSASPLGVVERVQLKWHLAICDGCKKYEEQSIQINSWLKSLNERTTINVHSNVELKDRLISTIKNKN